MTAISAVTRALFPNQVAEFVYDWQGRRIAKKVTVGSTVRHTRYRYEGWNVVAEWMLHGSSTTLLTPQTYLWGLDLAGQHRGDVAQLTNCGRSRRSAGEDERRQKDDDPDNDPPPTCYTGCGSTEQNQQANNGGWGVPGMYQNNWPPRWKMVRRDIQNSPHGPNHPDVNDDDYLPEGSEEDALMANIDSVTKAVCKDKCCKTVRIKITCHGFRLEMKSLCIVVKR